MYNIENIKIPFELFTTFNDIKFIESSHQYFLKYKQLTSVTTYLHKFQEKFDKEYWSERKADELGITKEEILAEWDSTNKKSTVKGTVVHNYIENLFLNKINDYPAKMIVEEFGSDIIKPEYDKIKEFVDDFYLKCKETLIPIKLEFIVYDEELGIAGMMDALFYNLKAQEFQIWDWKNLKKYTTENRFQNLKSPLNMLEDTHENLYSLQVNLYKYIIMRRIPSIKIGKCYIVWFNEKNDGCKIFQAKDYQHYIDMIFEKKLN